MSMFPKKLVLLLCLDSISIVVAAALLLSNFWHSAMAMAVALFIANIFLMPLAVRAQANQDQASYRRGAKPRLLGYALLVAALIRLALFAQWGFSWPGLAGVVAGALLGALFLFVAKRIEATSH